jgi:hypothetical protein
LSIKLLNINGICIGFFLFICALSICSQAKAQLGPRLFLTAELRAELERRRLGFVPAKPESAIIGTITDLLRQEKIEDTVYSLEGIMLRDDHTAIVWLNGAAIEESNLPANVQLVRSLKKPKLRVFSARNEEFELMPGQVINVSTSTLYESYQWQEVLEQKRRQALAAAAVGSQSSTQSDSIEE